MPVLIATLMLSTMEPRIVREIEYKKELTSCVMLDIPEDDIAYHFCLGKIEAYEECVQLIKRSKTNK